MSSSPRFGRKERGWTPRSVATRETIPSFLIVCEGEKTEPNYFAGFRVPAEIARVDIKGLGANTASLVRRAIALRDQGDYDQTWCVFDRDSFAAHSFNSALTLAANHGVQVAYSNESFEIWYLLHFHYFNTGMSRTEYGKKLSALLGFKYEKNSESMFAAIRDHQDVAIRNAERLLGDYKPPKPASDNPSTTVHLLVRELRRFER
jgi:hypothetical protein